MLNAFNRCRSLHILFTHTHTYIYIRLCITTLRCNATAMGLTCPGTNLTGDAGRPYKALWSFGPQTPEPMRCLAVVCVCVFNDVRWYVGMFWAFCRVAWQIHSFIVLIWLIACLLGWLIGGLMFTLALNSEDSLWPGCWQTPANKLGALSLGGRNM